MSPITKHMCGVILITVPSIQYGGYFLLQILSGKLKKLDLTDFQRSMFRAGHAHAGVLVILSLITEILSDHSALSPTLEWVERIGFPLAAILVSGGFFAAASGKSVTSPTKMISILYVGVFVLFISLLILGIGLIRSN